MSLAAIGLIFWAIVKFDIASGHARLMEPPSRASMWRLGFDNPADFNDNQGYCGGFMHQYGRMGGKCGICGDPWDADPREHETGGRYANGIIGRYYRPGEDIDVEIDVTANHFGYFTFKLCANNNTASDPQQDCFDRTVLPVLPHFEERYYLNSSRTGTYRLKLRMPNTFCKQCIVQWTYTGGNNWGLCEDGSGGGLGCGPQEIFRACADVAIEGRPVRHPDNEISHFKGTEISHETAQSNNTITPSTTSSTTSSTTATTGSGTASSAQPPPERGWLAAAAQMDASNVCVSVGVQRLVPGTDLWCQRNCNHRPQFCPATHCKCARVIRMEGRATMPTTPKPLKSFRAPKSFSSFNFKMGSSTTTTTTTTKRSKTSSSSSSFSSSRPETKKVSKKLAQRTEKGGSFVRKRTKGSTAKVVSVRRRPTKVYLKEQEAPAGDHKSRTKSGKKAKSFLDDERIGYVKFADSKGVYVFFG